MLTVGDVLKFEVMKNARVRTGKQLLEEKSVQWISVIEMPVENFVRKNEVVLSTAVGCGHDPELFGQFVKDIIQSGASALMIALGRFIFEIPKEVIEMAERNKFIIIEIPWEVRFSDITQEVVRALNDIQYKERRKSERIQQELLKLILKDTDLNRILQFVYNHIGSSILMTDRTGMIQSQINLDPTFIDRWKKYVDEGIIPIQKTDSHLIQDPMFHKFRITEIEGRYIIQLPVLEISSDPKGYLFVVLPSHLSIESFLTQYRINVLEHAATTISLWLSRKNAIEETKD